MTYTVKFEGEKECYESKKVNKSIYNAALSSGITQKEAHEIADKVEERITIWAKEKPQITSHKIYKKIFEELCELGQDDIAILYEHLIDVN
ncbi:MAG: hypothetical protein HRU03_01100 [Nanoarchaeales archaeon]|nr:hypothetical protein [Nanoarchaeales archaeon]